MKYAHRLTYTNAFSGVFLAFLTLLLVSSSMVLLNSSTTSALFITCPDGTSQPVEQGCSGESESEFRPFAEVVAVEPVLCGAGEYSSSILGIPVWYKYLTVQKDKFIYEDDEESFGKCSPSLADENGNITVFSVLPIGLAVLEAMMTLAGLVAVGMVIWASFNYVLSQGESDKAASARKTVMNAAIGLIIIIVATRVVSFIATRLTS